MATLFGQSVDIGSDKHSIVDDFMYGSNVASSHVYIRLGTFLFNHILLLNANHVCNCIDVEYGLLYSG